MQWDDFPTKHTLPSDLLIIEASSNTFSVVERLAKIGRKAIILESHRAGQIGKAYLANDKLDAAKIARIHLSGLATTVWGPDPVTRERRVRRGGAISITLQFHHPLSHVLKNLLGKMGSGCKY